MDSDYRNEKPRADVTGGMKDGASSTDGEATQQPRPTPSNAMTVEVPSMRSLRTRDASDSSNASATHLPEKEEDAPAFSQESFLPKRNKHSPLLLDTKQAAASTHDSAIGGETLNEGPEPPHAPDGEAYPLRPPSPVTPSLHHSPGKASKTDKTSVSTSSSPRDRKETPEASAGLPGSANKNAALGSTMPPMAPDEPAPELIEFYSNPDDDGYDMRSLLEAITNPQLHLRIQYALRTLLLVTFPLYTLALHPNTRYRLGFPQLLIASVVSTSTHRPTLGEQIGLHSWTWRGIIFMLIWGTVVDAWGVAYHNGAWYGILAAGIFGAGLVNNGNMRRFMFLYFFLYMLELRTHQHYFAIVPMNDAAYSALDYLIGSLMGVAANIIPFPSLLRDTVDMILTKIFAGFGKLLFGMINYTWSPDVHAAAFFYDDRAPFITIEAVLSHMSALLWFTSWEPMEFPLRNPIRQVKLSLLRRMMALGYAAFSCGRTIAAFRQQQADKVAMHKIRCRLYEAAHGRRLRAISAVHTPATAPSSGKSHSRDDEANEEQAKATELGAALRANTYTYVKDFAAVLMQATALVGSTGSTPEQLVKEVPFDALREKDTLLRRNARLEVLQVMKMQSDMVASKRAREQQMRDARGGNDSDSDDEHADSDDEEKQKCKDTLNVSKSTTGEDNLPYGSHRQRSAHRRADARLLLEHRELIDSLDVFLRINEIFFHLLISMIAGELINFGEQMKEYKPAESLPRRWWRHYIVEAWDGFWSELCCRVTLARPTDYRTVKDALRMTCAYLSATALNIELWNAENGLYFFGVTPLLGLPMEEESLGLGLCRIAGNTLGCALGYMAFHNTNNFAQQIAMVLCFTFILQVCKYHAQYGQFFFYGSVITLAGLATSMVFDELVTRLVTSSYTVMAYLICCLFLFPNDCRKICFNYRCKLTKVMSETIDDVALTARLPIECIDNNEADNDERGANEPVAYPRHNTAPMQMCSQLNVEVTLTERLLAMCVKWTPFAAGELVIRGMSQFPAGPNSLITFAHERMVANLRLLVFGVQLLHRPRSSPPSPAIAHLLRTSLADFLDGFADAVRLVGMDHVQALQRSRTWSYPRHLSRVSQLRRVRVRLHALMYECYVVVATHVSKDTFGMTKEDFDEMRREGAEQAALAAQGNAAGEASVHIDHGGEMKRKAHHDLDMHEDLSFLPGAGGNPVNGMAPPPARSQAAATAPGKPSNQATDGPSPMPAHFEVSAGEDATANMSFVDRYLVARRDEELTEAALSAHSLPSQRPSASPACLLDEPVPAEDGGNQQRSAQPHSPSHAFSTFDEASASSCTTSFARRRHLALYAHRAHLQQSGAEPADAWPLAIGSAEHDVEHILKAKKKQADEKQAVQPSTAPTGGGGMAPQKEQGAGDATPPPTYTPVTPSKNDRHVSKLILFPGKGPEAFIPLYEGPGFTYIEDELDMPVDTDLNAITIILLSCESIMAELTALPGSLNTLTSYDKQLQESSMATATLDKWSAAMAAYRKGVHDRYHYPKPPPQKRRPMHAQEDPFEDWKF